MVFWCFWVDLNNSKNHYLFLCILYMLLYLTQSKTKSWMYDYLYEMLYNKLKKSVKYGSYDKAILIVVIIYFH